MIYLDNAATTLKKPPCVAEAVVRLFDAQPASRVCAAAALALGVLFFVSCLMFMRAGKRERA